MNLVFRQIISSHFCQAWMLAFPRRCCVSQPIGNDEWVKYFVQEKAAAAVQADVVKMDIISGGLLGILF
jgi:hypothetical protein